MKKTFIILLLTGAAIAALSFLLAGFKSEIVSSIRWAIFAFGIIIVIVSVIVLIIAVKSSQKPRLLPDGAEYRRKDSIMSQPEQELYRTLTETLMRTRYVVLPQIALVSVIDKVKGGGFRNELFRIADFCIVDGRTFAPVLLIELNDASHKRDERKLRDDKVRAICDAADLPVVAFSLDDPPQKIRSVLRKYL